MNAPLPESIRRALDAVSLDDKYSLPQGRAFMSGVQALVRLPMLQKTCDRAAGLNTAGFVSGYRGSPLGTYDQALWQAKAHLAAQDIVFQPGVNEELAATAVWGTQQLDLFPATRKFDGVFGIWYGKGPGVDRCSDVFKHANMAGTAKLGGVIAVAGDDHIAKSSTAAHQSDHIFKACGLPVFFPSNVQDILDMGLHAFALSRFAGVWSGMKTIQEIVESSSSVFVDPDRVDIVLPDDFPMPPGGLHIRWPDAPLEQEARLFDHKWYAALAYVRANKLNHDVISTPRDRFGLIASGKAYNDTRQALRDLGLDDDACRRLGIRLHKVNVVWPLEATITREFARGLQEILVVEEKRQVIEYQLKEELYNWRADVRPNVLGKFDEAEDDPAKTTPFGGGGGRRMEPAEPERQLAAARAGRPDAGAHREGDRQAAEKARRRRRCRGAHRRPAGGDRRQGARHHGGAARRQPVRGARCGRGQRRRRRRGVAGAGPATVVLQRLPAQHQHPCARRLACAGRHRLPLHGVVDGPQHRHLQPDGRRRRRLDRPGALLLGQACFREPRRRHLFPFRPAGGAPEHRRRRQHHLQDPLQRRGRDDRRTAGRRHHAGAGNDARARRRGCQPHRRRQRRARKVRRRRGSRAAGAGRHGAPPRRIRRHPAAAARHRRLHRHRLRPDLRHREAPPPQARHAGRPREARGHQRAGLRRLRRLLGAKQLPEHRAGRNRIRPQAAHQPEQLQQGLFLRQRLLPELRDGRRRPAEVAKKQPVGGPAANVGRPDPSTLPPLPEPALPDPALPDVTQRPWGIVVAGVGGTGVITIGQLLGMAAHLEGKGVVTQDAAGLAQKGGATWSHIQIAQRGDAILTTKVGTAEADLVIGCDPIVTANPATLAVMREGRTAVVLNRHGAPTAAFVADADWQFPGGACEAAIGKAIGAAVRFSPGGAAVSMTGAAVGATAGEAGSSARFDAFDAERLAVQLVGDSLYTNPLLLGTAWQRGLVPLGRTALMRAMELNGVQVDKNKAAFEWGRRAAHDLPALQALLKPESAQVIAFVRKPSADATALVATRAEFLTAYQNAAYAAQYRAFVGKVQAAEAPLNGGSRLTEAVARGLFKLMAYKDEYEVARLHADRSFLDKLAAQFEGDYTLHYHLAPPGLAKRNARGEAVKTAFGPWMLPVFRVLARLKSLRGSAFDPFGHSAERRGERALIGEYRVCIDELLATLDRGNLALAVRIAGLPDDIRGYGHVKERHLNAVRPKWAALLAEWRAGAQRQAA